MEDTKHPYKLGLGRDDGAATTVRFGSRYNRLLISSTHPFTILAIIHLNFGVVVTVQMIFELWYLKERKKNGWKIVEIFLSVELCSDIEVDFIRV